MRAKSGIIGHAKIQKVYYPEILSKRDTQTCTRRLRRRRKGKEEDTGHTQKTVVSKEIGKTSS